MNFRAPFRALLLCACISAANCSQAGDTNKPGAENLVPLKIKLPAGKPCDYAYSFKITGLKLK